MTKRGVKGQRGEWSDVRKEERERDTGRQTQRKMDRREGSKDGKKTLAFTHNT